MVVRKFIAAAEICAAGAAGLGVPMAFVPAELGCSWHGGIPEMVLVVLGDVVGACLRFSARLRFQTGISSGRKGH